MRIFSIYSLLLLSLLLGSLKTWAIEFFSQGIKDGTFVGPNEFYPHLIRSALKDQSGVYMGVGTFRVIDAVADANFSDTVFADYDRYVVEFNELNVEAIHSSPDRVSYLSKLFGKNPNSQMFKKVQKGEVDIFTFQKWLLSESDRIDPPVGSIEGKIKVFMDKLPKEKKKMFSINVEAYTEDGWLKSYLGNDFLYAKARQKLEKSKSHFIVMDYSNSNAATKLAAKFAQDGKKISVIDISNLLQYFGDTKKLWRGFVESIEQLPVSKDAVLLSTVNGDIMLGEVDIPLKRALNNTMDDGWLYLSQRIDTFLNSIKSKGLPKDYLSWLTETFSKREFNRLVGRKISNRGMPVGCKWKEVFQ